MLPPNIVNLGNLVFKKILSSSMTVGARWYRFSLPLVLAFLFFVAMNLYAGNMGGSGLQIPYNMFSWLTVSCVIILGVFRVLACRELKIYRVTVHYLLFFVVLLAPLIYVDTLFLDVELFRLAGIAAGIAFLIAIQQDTNQSMRRNFIFIIFISTLIQTSLGLVQHYVFVEGSEYIYLSQVYRPFGIFQQVNVFSVYLGVGVLSGIYLWSTSRFSQSLIVKIGLFVLVFVNGNLIALSKAEAAQAVNIICVIAYVYLLAIPKAGQRRYLYSLVLAFIMGLLFTMVTLETDAHTVMVQDEASTSMQVSHSNDGDDNNTTVDIPHFIFGKTPVLEALHQMAGTRPTIYLVALKMFLDDPIDGYGIGAFRRQYLLHQGEFLKSNPSWPGEFSLSHPHNEPLYWAIELGLVSALAFVYLFVFWVVAVRKKYLDPKIFFLTSPFILHSLLELPFYHSAPHWLAFLVLLSASIEQQKYTVLKIPLWSAIIVVPTITWGFLKAWIFILSSFFALKMFLLFEATDRQVISYLTEIENPSAFKLRYEFELFQWNFRESQKIGMIDIDQLNAFLAWGYSTIQYAPMATTYENFVTGLVITDNLVVARRYLDEAILMYPNDKRFQLLDVQLIRQELESEF